MRISSPSASARDVDGGRLHRVVSCGVVSFGVLSCGVVLSACGGKVVFDASGAGGSASSTTQVSSTTHASVASGAGGASACPVIAPVAGEPCATPPGLVCPLPEVCCQPTATCVGGHWSVTQPGCGATCVPCGPDLECAYDAVCVAVSVVNTVVHHCAANPCGSLALSCGCAAPACQAYHATCVSTQASQIACDTGTEG